MRDFKNEDTLPMDAKKIAKLLWKSKSFRSEKLQTLMKRLKTTVDKFNKTELFRVSYANVDGRDILIYEFFDYLFGFSDYESGKVEMIFALSCYELAEHFVFKDALFITGHEEMIAYDMRTEEVKRTCIR